MEDELTRFKSQMNLVSIRVKFPKMKESKFYLRTPLSRNCHIPSCQDKRVAMATTVVRLQLLVLSRIEFILHFMVPKDNRISQTSCCYGSLVAMATTFTP